MEIDSVDDDCSFNSHYIESIFMYNRMLWWNWCQIFSRKSFERKDITKEIYGYESGNKGRLYISNIKILYILDGWVFSGEREIFFLHRPFLLGKN